MGSIEKSKQKFIILLIILLFLFFLPGFILAQDPLRSPEVYSLFLDWLNGKSMGLVSLRVVPVDENGTIVKDDFNFYLHNFTDYWSKIRSERIYEGSSQNIVVKLWRLLSGDKWREQEFTVVVVGKNYFGAKLIKITPEKPLLSIEEKVVVNKIKKQEKLGSYVSKSSKSLVQGPPPNYEVQTTNALSNAVQLHTIPGVTAYVAFSSGNYLYFSQKSRLIGWDPASDSIVVESDWSIAGAKSTICGNDVNTLALSNGDKRWVKVYVNYKYERWPTTGVLPYNYYELETPVDFGGWSWGDSISCSYCGGKPSGNIYGYPQGTPTPFSIALGKGINQIETTGAKVIFSVSYGQVTVTVELWKEISNGTSASPPKLVVANVNWQGNLYAFDSGSERKIVHFTWTPP